MKKFVIHWKSLHTDKTGNGTTEFTEEEAVYIVFDLNQEYDGVLHHWYAEVAPHENNPSE